MEHLSSLKIYRAILAGATLLVLTGSVEASLNILGMPMNLQVGQDVMDFNMGSSSHTYKSSGSSNDDEECDDDEDATGNKMGNGDQSQCLEVKPSAWTLSNMYRDQPLFMNFRPRTEEAMLIDNMCFTFFPLPDDQFTYVMYTSTVYRDGSNLVESDIVTDVQLGIFRAASPYCTYKDHVLGYAGCDTFVMYRCYMSSDCRNRNSLYTYGLSQSCKQISISCLQKIEDIIQGNGIPEQDYVALPMKLPTRCVFDPVCTFKDEVTEFISPVETVLIYEEPEIIFEPEVFFEPEIIAPSALKYFGLDNFYSRPSFSYPYNPIDCRNRNSLYTYGLSQSCKQISISCLQKIEDIIQGNGIPEQDYVALPMKLPTRCVFDPVCTFKEEVEVEIISPAREIIFVEEDIFPEPEPFFTLASKYNVDRFIPDTPVLLGPSRRQGDFLSYNHNNYFKR